MKYLPHTIHNEHVSVPRYFVNDGRKDLVYSSTMLS